MLAIGVGGGRGCRPDACGNAAIGVSPSHTVPNVLFSHVGRARSYGSGEAELLVIRVKRTL